MALPPVSHVTLHLGLEVVALGKKGPNPARLQKNSKQALSTLKSH